MVEKYDEGRSGFWPRAGALRRKTADAESKPVQSEGLTVSLVTFDGIFSGEARYGLTDFQRAYSWRAANVARLISDVAGAANDPSRRSVYCLGRLTLAQAPASNSIQIVDGHQRLLTTTMIIAVLRDLETDTAEADRLHGYLEAQPLTRRGAAELRFVPQTGPAELFQSLVQKRGATLLDFEGDFEELSETECNIVENRDFIRSALQSPMMSAMERRHFATYLLRRCKVIAVTTTTQDEAWELTINELETRLEFSEADQAKSNLLAPIPAAERAMASSVWEACEARLVSEDMYRLLGHIRAMTWRGRIHSNKPVEIEIAKHFDLGKSGTSFMNDVLLPNAERLEAIRGDKVCNHPETRASVTDSIALMTWIDAHNWVPAALQWMKCRGSDAPETALFFKRLERLIWLMRIAGVDPNKQETRVLAVLGEIDSSKPVEQLKFLKPDVEHLADALSNLRGSGFAKKGYSGPVLRRISRELGADSGPITNDKVTLEHVLPTKAPEHGPWREAFKSKVLIRANSQRLGNMTLLSPPHNQEAGTREWRFKRLILASSGFVLSRKAAEYDTWTPQTIAQRTEELIAVLFKTWGLSV